MTQILKTCMRCNRERSQKYIGIVLGGYKCYAVTSCKEYRKKNK